MLFSEKNSVKENLRMSFPSISFSALGVDMNIVVFGMVGAIIQVMLNIAFAPSLVHVINSFKLTFFGGK